MTAAPTLGARPTRWLAALTIALLAVLVALALPGRSAAGPAPKGFFGVHPLKPDPMAFDEMADADVGIIRTGFLYQSLKPLDLPPAPELAMPYDPIVAEAARNDVDLLPVLLGTSPGGPGTTPLDTPAATADWKRYVTALVERYGPGGYFWTVGPGALLAEERPITDWQVWNEPNAFGNWADPSPKRYGRLLTISSRAIHAVDPTANVVSAGVISEPVNPRAEDGDAYLREMLRSKAARDAVGTIAIHPYTGEVEDVQRQIELTRKVLDKARLRRTPIWITEIGWGSGNDSNPLIVSPARQKRNLRDAFRMMLAQRRKLNIGRVIWYQWQDGPDAVCRWCGTSGLLDESGNAKPLRDEFAAIARR